MRASSIDRLALVGGLVLQGHGRQDLLSFGLSEHFAAESLVRFAGMFPDQCGWVLLLGQAMQVSHLAPLLSQLQYSGPPELLSMYCCLYMGQATARILAKVPKGGVSVAADLRNRALAYSRQHGQPPHPLTLLDQTL
jgi:hypothetical protein